MFSKLSHTGDGNDRRDALMMTSSAVLASARSACLFRARFRSNIDQTFSEILKIAFYNERRLFV